jgi:hypothetical protein
MGEAYRVGITSLIATYPTWRIMSQKPVSGPREPVIVRASNKKESRRDDRMSEVRFTSSDPSGQSLRNMGHN